jgi:hypothetical protein
VLARVIIFATRRELVDKLVDRQIAIARKKGRKKENCVWQGLVELWLSCCQKDSDAEG